MSDASSQESSVRSDMFIVSPPRLDRAPSGAACSDRRRAVRHMPLLAELKNRMVAVCFYKHAAPDGATARAPLLEIARPVHFLILTLLALAAVQTRAEDVASAFQSANRLYEENKFAEAA